MCEAGQTPGQAQAKPRVKVAYLGPKETTHTGLITKRYYPDAERVPCVPIPFVVYAVENGTVDLGVVPLGSNSKAGTVMETLVALSECQKARIVGEVFSPIHHYVGVRKVGGESEEALRGRRITRFYSKDKALTQCLGWILAKYPGAQPVALDSTGAAVDCVVSDETTDIAAIATREEIESRNEMVMLARDIVPDLRTRFAIVGREDIAPIVYDPKEVIGYKAFIAIYPPGRDEVGSLEKKILHQFSVRGINLGEIHSLPNGAVDNMFFMEVELGEDKKNPGFREALDVIGFNRVLGIYQDSRWRIRMEEAQA